MKKERILFVVSRFLDGGLDTVLVNYLNAFANLHSEVQVTIAIMVQYDGLEVFIDRVPKTVNIIHLVSGKWLTANVVKRYEGTISKSAKIFDELFFNAIRRQLIKRRLRGLQRENDVIIDFDSQARSFIDFDLPTLKIAYFHFSIGYLKRTNARYMDRVARGLMAYDKIICLCNDMYEECKKAYPNLADKLVVIYNPIDIAQIEKMSEVGISDTFFRDRYILASMRLEESQKDLTTLIKAYAILRKEDITRVWLPRLIVIGDGPHREKLQRTIDECGLHEDVILYGFVKNPYAIMSHAEMIVHSAKYEGFGMVVAEAIALGLAVVCTNCPVGPREVLADGKAGMLIPVGDEKSMAKAIKQILTNEPLRYKYKTQAKQYAERFSTKNVVEKLLSVCNG